tara:strand:- start:4126 stop:4428 length:303 start_codon:yes stop_codon:yes gene_type:complete
MLQQIIKQKKKCPVNQISYFRMMKVKECIDCNAKVENKRNRCSACYVKNIRKNKKYIVIFLIVICLDILINTAFLIYTGGSHKSQLSFIDKLILEIINQF